MRQSLLAILFLGVLAAAPARANFIVSITSGSVAAGGTTTLSVWAHSDNSSGETLESFGVELLITQLSGTGRLEFVNPQSDAGLANPSYVFFGDSLFTNTMLPFASISTTNISTPNDTYNGGDLTDSGLGVPVGNTDRLLAILDLNAAFAMAGDRYQIALIGRGSGLGTTFFADPAVTYYAWSSGVGLLDITPGSPLATPAPPSLFLGLIGAVGVGGLRLVRRRPRLP